MMINTRTPPTTPPAIAPVWLLFEDFLLLVFDGVGVDDNDDGLTGGSFVMVVVVAFRFRENISCNAVKFQLPSGSVRAAFPEELFERKKKIRELLSS